MFRVKRLFALTALLWGVGLLGSCSGPKSLQGEYQVIGSPGVTSASVTYNTAAQVSASAISVSLPWTYSFTGYETEGSNQGTNVYLSALNNSNTGSITVIIDEAGSVFQQSYAVWPQAAITVSGSF